VRRAEYFWDRTQEILFEFVDSSGEMLFVFVVPSKMYDIHDAVGKKHNIIPVRMTCKY
jgi:hypothetical protein